MEIFNNITNILSAANGFCAQTYGQTLLIQSKKTIFFKEKTGFGPRFVACKATVEPIYPLEEKHNVMRDSSSKDYICLEENGLLGITTKFQISDKKALGVKTKGRRLSVLYKVECADFKSVLNAGLAGGFVSSIDGTEQFSLMNIKQTFKGLFNGVPIEFTVTKEELGSSFSTKGEAFLKFITYKSYYEYRKNCVDLPSSDPRFVDSAALNILIDPGNMLNSSGLYLNVGYNHIFGEAAPKPTQQFGLFMEEQVDGKGRIKALPKPAPTTSSSFTASTEFFNVFSSLPASFNLLEVGGHPSPPLDFMLGQAEFNALVQGATLARNHSLVLESRLTTYEIAFSNMHNKLNTKKAITYCYYENSQKCARAFVQCDFLGASFHKTLLQYIAECHSSRIVYTSLNFESYEEKVWQNSGSFCKKGSLSCFSKKEHPFKLLLVGKHLNDTVNFSTNLLFTAEFQQETGNFYKTNRFITCSAFTSQNEVASASYQALFLQLEKAFLEPIILSDIPLVRLVPCFERGTVVQVAENIYFRGMVSNASSLPDSF